MLRAVCDYLSIQERLGKLVYWRQNNGATYDPRRNVYRKPTGAGYKAGVPDVAVILRGGRFVGLEVKAPKGTQSPEQKTLQNAIEAVGGVYAVVRSVDDVVATLSSWLQNDEVHEPKPDANHCKVDGPSGSDERALKDEELHQH